MSGRAQSRPNKENKKLMHNLKVIKIGGNIIDNQDALQTFLEQFSKIEGPKILIHGGGKLASQLANQMNVEVKMVDGRRITDQPTLDIITMVYAGKINKNIVAKLQANQCIAIGFSGADGNTIVSVKRPIKNIDYGFVGDVVHVNTKTLNLLLNNNITPVFCAITHDENGQLLNTNADTIASELAIGFAKEYKTELYYCFEKNGVLEDINDEASVIENMNAEIYQSLIEQKVISDGMLPKLNNCFYAINNGVFKVHIGKPKMLFKATTHTTIQT
jgi:acetylglutamate kinase